MCTFTRNIADGRKILLLRNVFDIPRLDPRVQANASDVLRHCSTSTALLGMSIEYVPRPSLHSPCLIPWKRMVTSRMTMEKSEG